MRFALLTLLILAGIAAAECHLRARTTYSSYYSPPALYYKTGVSYKQYETPEKHCDEQLYYYKEGYYYPYKEQKKVVLVPKAIEVETYRNHYYSIDPYMQQNLLADAIVGRLLRMQDTKSLTVVPNPALPNPTVPSVGIGDDRAGTYQEAKLLNVVSTSCAKCHGAGSKYTKFVTNDGKLTDLTAGKVWEAFGLVNSGEMPKTAKSLDDESVKLFYAWAKNARK